MSVLYQGSRGCARGSQCLRDLAWSPEDSQCPYWGTELVWAVFLLLTLPPPCTQIRNFLRRGILSYLSLNPTLTPACFRYAMQVCGMKFSVSDNISQPPHKGGDLKSQSVNDTKWRPGVRGARENPRDKWWRCFSQLLTTEWWRHIRVWSRRAASWLGAWIRSPSTWPWPPSSPPISSKALDKFFNFWLG